LRGCTSFRSPVCFSAEALGNQGVEGLKKLTRLEGRVDRLNTVPQAGRPAASIGRTEMLPQFCGKAIANGKPN